MKPEQTSVSVVLLGKFKPSDFDLEHFRLSKALGVDDLAKTTYEALWQDQAVVLNMPWGKFSVLNDRLSVETAQVPYLRGLDLILKLISEVSPNSLVNKFGINMTSHFRFPDIAARDKFATRLVPPDGWGAFGQLVKQSFSEKSDKHGGLMRVTMRHARPDDRSAGWLDVTVEPSAVIASDQGVAITLNDHHEVSTEDSMRLRGLPRAISEVLLEELAANFESSMERSFSICDDLTKDRP